MDRYMNEGDERRLKAIAVPVKSFEDSAFRDVVARAGIVRGLDTSRDSLSLFFGRRMLKDILAGRAAEWGPQLVVVVAYDQRTNEFEYLVAAVKVLKGSCDIEEAIG